MMSYYITYYHISSHLIYFWQTSKGIILHLILYLFYSRQIFSKYDNLIMQYANFSVNMPSAWHCLTTKCQLVGKLLVIFNRITIVCKLYYNVLPMCRISDILVAIWILKIPFPECIIKSQQRTTDKKQKGETRICLF